MKKPLLFVLFLLLALAGKAQATLNTSVTSSSLCANPGLPFSVSFSDAAGAYNSTNVFTAELSDATGSFANPQVIGTQTSMAPSGIIQAALPTWVAAGTGYRIRVTSSDPVVIGNDNGTDLTVVQLPQVTVSPQVTSVCGGTPVQLSASGIGTFSWAPGATLSSTSGSVVTATPVANTTYTVYSTNACGSIGATAQVNVSNTSGFVFQESMGQVTATTNVAAHEASNGFDNDQFTFSGIGTDIRNTLPSTGYANASGGANVQINFNDVTNPSRQFRIEGINTFGMTNLQLSFGIRKNTASSNGSELVVEASVDGGATWTPIPFTPLPLGSGTNTIWHFVSTSGIIPQAQNLSIRFRQTASNVQFRIDDVRLENAGASQPTITTSSPASSFCPGNPIHLTASGGTSYQWSTGATGQVITVTQAGSYTVTVLNAGGCYATSNPVVLTGSGQMPVVSSNSPVCAGQTLQLSATGNPGLTYSWVGPNGFSSTVQHPTITFVTWAHSGIYTLSTNIPGCGPVSATTTVSVLPGTFTPAVFGNTPLCEGQVLAIGVQAVPTSTYTWSYNGVAIPGANGPSYSLPNITAAQAGTYSVLVENSCGTGTAGIPVTVNAVPAAPVATNNGPICQGQALLLSASSVPGAVYSWSYFGFSSNQQYPVRNNAQPGMAGTYSIFATLNGCTSPAGTTQVVINPIAPPVSIQSNLPVCPGSTLLLTAVGGAAGQYSWSGPNNFSGTGSNVSVANLQPADYGTYTIYSGAAACGSTATIQVGAPQLPGASSNSPVCPGADIQLFADTVAGANVAYSWSGPNGFTSTQQNPVIANAAAVNVGQYSVFLVLPGCVSAPTVTQVDVNATLTLTAASNSPLNQGSTLMLSASGSPGTYSWSGPNGYSAVGQNPYLQNVTPANAGNYTVSVNSAGCTAAQAVVSVAITPMNQITGLVFHDLNNNGVQDAGENGFGGVLVMLNPGNYMAYSNSAGQFSAFVPDGTYSVAPIGLAPTQNATPISRTVTVTGSNQVSAGNTFAVYTTPTNNLAISVFPWSNTAPGFPTYYDIYAVNYGQTTMSGTIRFKADPLLTFTYATGGYSLSGDTVVWAFSNLLPGQYLYKSANFSVPVGTLLGTVLTAHAKVTPIVGDAAPANNTYTLTQTVVGSWDPNDKAVSPVGPISPAQVAAAQELNYTIRFQNTGTAPAVNILIADTLSNLLDLSTFQMLSSSHNYNLTMHENGNLEWHFPNIMLPDSNANEPLSHGYIQYSIKPKTTLQLGDEITNTAHIFFDFNEAVITNTTSTIVALPNGIAETKEEQLLHVFPNPNNGNATLKFTAPNQAETTVSVLNLLGQEVLKLKKTTEAGEVEIPVDLQQQPAGIYLVKVQQNEKVFSAKLVRQ